MTLIKLVQKMNILNKAILNKLMIYFIKVITLYIFAYFGYDKVKK